MALWSVGRSNKSLSLTLTTIFVWSLITSCGSQDTSHDSNLQWSQSRPNNPNYAYLHQEDLEDPFYLGMSVTATSGFDSNALNMMVQPIGVKLFLEDDGSQVKLRVKSKASDGSFERLLSFNVAQKKNYWEIDFASSGNDIEFNQMVEAFGGVYTAMDQKGRWISQGLPRVLRVSQDPDTVVIDLQYTVKQVRLETDENGQTQIVPVSKKAGKVTVRMWLKRQSSAPNFDDFRSVGEGKDLNIGYFGASFLPDAANEGTTPIQRFAGIDVAKGKKVTFYLKDFPRDYLPVAKKAVTSWNEAFGFDALEAKVAPAHIDVGDPRYMVIKWFDKTDQGLPWAGVAKMITMPGTGAVVGGGIYIQGDTLINMYQKIHQYSLKATKSAKLQGSLGGVSFTMGIGENPVIPFLTDIESNFKDYIQDYYLETIAHEVGHVLGLRHNFKGSTQLDAFGQSASVMDYLPRSQRTDYKGPGLYDIAAIKWGYFGILPEASLPFCTDEDLWTVWNCSQGEYGDSIDFTIQSLIDSSDLLAKSAVPVTDYSIFASISGVIENAIKMWSLREQMPQDQKDKLEDKLPKAYNYLRQITPSPSLNQRDQAIASKNIEVMKSFVKKKEEMLKQAGRF